VQTVARLATIVEDKDLFEIANDPSNLHRHCPQRQGRSEAVRAIAGDRPGSSRVLPQSELEISSNHVSI
jgi:hypothetical protein